MPPPGTGFTTVTDAVPAVAMFAAGTVAVGCELLTKFVASAIPFQFTTELETKPVPLAVKVKLAPPGMALAETSGLLISGTGLDCANTIVLSKIVQKEITRNDFMAFSV